MAWVASQRHNEIHGTTPSLLTEIMYGFLPIYKHTFDLCLMMLPLSLLFSHIVERM